MSYYSRLPKCQFSHIFSNKALHTQGVFLRETWHLGSLVKRFYLFQKLPTYKKELASVLCMSYILKKVCHTYSRVYVIHTQECMSYILVGQCLVYVIHTHMRLASVSCMTSTLALYIHEYVWHTRLAFEYVLHLSMYGVATASRID